jgi:hypothetical protein
LEEIGTRLALRTREFREGSGCLRDEKSLYTMDGQIGDERGGIRRRWGCNRRTVDAFFGAEDKLYLAQQNKAGLFPSLLFPLRRSRNKRGQRADARSSSRHHIIASNGDALGIARHTSSTSPISLTRPAMTPVGSYHLAKTTSPFQLSTVAIQRGVIISEDSYSRKQPQTRPAQCGGARQGTRLGDTRSGARGR